MVVATVVGRHEGLMVDGWWVTSDAMLISISDSVSHEVSGTEAVASEGCCGDLNVEDFSKVLVDTPFLLM